MELPTCALIQHRGTVIIRFREMDVCNGCNRPEAYRSQCHPMQPLDNEVCELCTRTSNEYSDCDNGPYECQRWRPYRARPVKSRYVNVCAAVCLLLLVGGFSPQTTAAPHRSARDSRKMDRERRDSTSAKEYFWENPCDYNESDPRPVLTYTPKLAKQAALQAKTAFNSAVEYKDQFAYTTHSYHSFEELIAMWESYKWLREFSWYRDEMLPPEKVFGHPVSDQYMDAFVKKGTSRLDETLPVMYKGLKVVVAALDAMDRDGMKEGFLSDLRRKVNMTKHNVRAVLCLFSDILTSRKLPQDDLKLDESDIPDFKGSQPDKMIMVYRDTLLYVEYLAQVFQKMYEENI